jgi:C1A family cysteine protease
MTHEEYLETLNLQIPTNRAPASLKRRGNGGNNGRRNGRKLQDQSGAVAVNVDLANDGKVGPVKDQGYCGSCWAFAATTQLEGAIAIANNQTPVRQSEQQLVDCTTNTQANQDMFG